MTLNPQFLVSVITLFVVANVLLGAVAYAILLERKIASWVQDRIGPNRVGFSFGQAELLDKVGLGKLARFHFWGLGQPAADGLKMMIKEDYNPPSVERPLFILAPLIVVVPALLAWAIIPWGGYWDFPGLTIGSWTVAPPARVLIAAASIDIGILYVLAVGSVGVYGVVVGAYASNNKYSFLGGLRATAQMLSYEIPLGLCVLILLLMAGTSRADLLLALQSQIGWNIIYMPLVAVIFFTCSLAETNRTPFDLAEAEQELVGGYHTEYSSMKFALYFLAEYMHVISGMALFTLLFLGGWSISPLGLWPDLPVAGGLGLVLLKIAIYAGKVFGLVALVMVVRWTLPRFRFDQLMRLAWRGLIPIMLAILLGVGAIQFAVVSGWVSRSLAPWLVLAVNGLVLVGAAIVGPMLPAGAPVNRRVPLEGSRFCPPQPQ